MDCYPHLPLVIVLNDPNTVIVSILVTVEVESLVNFEELFFTDHSISIQIHRLKDTFKFQRKIA